MRKKLSSQAGDYGITPNQQDLCFSQRHEHRAAQHTTQASGAQLRRIVFLGSQRTRLLESRASHLLVYSETPKTSVQCGALISSSATEQQAQCWCRAHPMQAGMRMWSSRARFRRLHSASQTSKWRGACSSRGAASGGAEAAAACCSNGAWETLSRKKMWN